MTTLSAQEILRKHGIPFIASKKGKYTTTCPHCDGGYLNVEIKSDAVIWYCRDCEQGDGEKFEQGNGTDKSGELGAPKAIFDYRDEQWRRLFQVLRFEPIGKPKTFRQRTGPDQKKWSIAGVRLVVFMLPELLEAIENDRVVFIPEGEKDVFTLRTHGIDASCNAMGAGKWRDEYAESFHGADVVLVPDNDEVGRAHMRDVATNLLPVVRCLRLLDLKTIWPAIGPSDDVTDWFERGGGTAAQLLEIIGRLPPLTAPPEIDKPKLLISRAQFLKGYVAPDYLVDGVIQKHYIYSLTGSTGGGKTALAHLLTDTVSCDDPQATFGGHPVEKGKVIYFVGENPDDLRARMIGADTHRRDDPSKDEVHFVVGIYNIEEIFEEVAKGAEALGGVDLIIIDTSAAYFLGDDETNPKMGEHARKLRTLTKLPGGPCVLALCHPTKYATTPDQLLPRGGGAFLAEMDGNLTAWKHDEDLIELHHTGKLRGPGFEPMSFRLDKITTPKLVDSKGRKIPTVRAVAVSEQEEAEHARDSRKDEDIVLQALLDNADRSQRDLAKACGFTTAKGEAYISKLQRIAHDLKASRLIKSSRGGRWALTEEGQKAAKKLKAGENEERIEQRGATPSTKKFFAVVRDKCSLACVHCGIADGHVFKVKDGRVKKSRAEALHVTCAEEWYTGKPQPKEPAPPNEAPDLLLDEPQKAQKTG
jgi:hypothetical protein